MYTLEQLQQKTFGELKAIGWELNVLPEGDRRHRQTWIDAIAGINPPLLQLLEVSPAEVEQAQEPPIESKFGRIVYPRPHQEPIAQVAKNSPGVESVEPTQKAPEHKFLVCLKDGDNTLWYDGKDFVLEKWSAKTYCKRGVGGAKHQLRFHPEVKRVGNVPQVVENSPRVQVESIEVQRQESKSGLAFYPCPVQQPIAQVAKKSPGVEVDRDEDELPECSTCFGDGYVEDEFGRVKFCQCEPKLSRQKTESAIVPAAQKLPWSESDLNPILTGIVLSDRFLARYAPPQAETLHYEITDGYKVDTGGQLSFFEAQVVSEPEPPDPDDFDSLDAFNDAMARWDAENAEALTVSMDSMCYWAPCPDEWYEPEPESLLLKASSMTELSPPAIECSLTSANFTIPTFDAWCDRANRQTDTDEPPDTGIFA